MNIPTLREMEAALADALYKVEHDAEGDDDIRRAHDVLHHLAAHRAAARAARPMVERWMVQWGFHGLSKRPLLDALLDCLWHLVGQGSEALPEVLRVYDRHCDNVPPPTGESSAVAMLVSVLAGMAVEEQKSG